MAKNVKEDPNVSLRINFVASIREKNLNSPPITFPDHSILKIKQRRDIDDKMDDYPEAFRKHHGHKKKKRHKFKIKKKYKKFLLPLLLAYKLKFFTLIPVFISGLILLLKSAGMAGFFFALFAGKWENF